MLSLLQKTYDSNGHCIMYCTRNCLYGQGKARRCCSIGHGRKYIIPTFCFPMCEFTFPCPMCMEKEKSSCSIGSCNKGNMDNRLPSWEMIVIPPSSTHIIFVLLPNNHKRYFSVSVWEATHANPIFSQLQGANVMWVWADMMLLPFILNGNDCPNCGAQVVSKGHTTSMARWQGAVTSPRAILGRFHFFGVSCSVLCGTIPTIGSTGSFKIL